MAGLAIGLLALVALSTPAQAFETISTGLPGGTPGTCGGLVAVMCTYPYCQGSHPDGTCDDWSSVTCEVYSDYWTSSFCIV